MIGQETGSLTDDNMLRRWCVWVDGGGDGGGDGGEVVIFVVTIDSLQCISTVHDPSSSGVVDTSQLNSTTDNSFVN